MEIYKRFTGYAMGYATGTGNLKGFVNVVGNNKFDSAFPSIRSKFRVCKSVHHHIFK
jgi:hypothetical protein